MEKKNNSGIIILLMGVIIVILLVLCVLFATNIISLNINNNSKGAETNNQTNDQTNDIVNANENTDNSKDSDDREEIIVKLKAALSDNEWIESNLYVKENAFGWEVNSTDQNLYFLTVSDEENNPIVIVLNEAPYNFIVTCYKVYVSNGTVVVKNITGNVSHPAHVGFSVDEKQGLVIYEYGHMGEYTFRAYDIKSDEIKIYDEYTCDNCEVDEYEYKGSKQYNTFSSISTKLTSDNINNYLK